MLTESAQHQYSRIGDFCIDNDLRYQFSDDAQEEADDLLFDIDLVEVREDGDSLAAIVSVPPSADLLEPKQSVTVRIDESSGAWSTQCDCGVTGGCKHIVAALVFIETDSGACIEFVD